jgi:beta-glucuronidase
MYEFVKGVDASRPVTFAALGGKLKEEGYADPASTSLGYVDFICVNFYFSPEESGRRLDATHAQWPDKPILITEWGRRADQMEEGNRAQYIRNFMEMVRGRDYVVGASFWSYNDYRSRYPGTNKDGYRHWGLVNAQREPRAGYHAIREEFAPVTLDGEAKVMAGGTIQGRVKVTGRTDFPRYTIRSYDVKASLVNSQGRTLAERVQMINKLRPGQSSEFEFDYDVNALEQIAHLKVEVFQPTGFSILDYTIEVHE